MRVQVEPEAVGALAAHQELARLRLVREVPPVVRHADRVVLAKLGRVRVGVR